MRAVRHGKTVCAHLSWTEGAAATLTFLAGWPHGFHASLFGSEGVLARTISPDGCYVRALEVILGMIESRTPALSADQLLRPVALVHVIRRSLESGGEEVRQAP